jgi:hypothetical protein
MGLMMIAMGTSTKVRFVRQVSLALEPVGV